MMNKLKSILTIAVLSSATVAIAQKESEPSLFVNKVNGNINIDGHQVLYSLPQNSLVVNLKISKTNYVQGPYAQYAEKYLNITTGIINETKTAYQIETISVERYSQPDTSQLYAINYSGLDYLPMVRLNADGTILSCNSKNAAEGYGFVNIQSDAEPVDGPIAFHDLGVKPFVVDEELDNEDDDTLAVKKPKQVTTIVRTPEENAAAAAAFIRKIRKRRLKLLVGMAEETNAVDGLALKTMLSELETLEKEYLSLFVGKQVQASYTQSFSVCPTDAAQEQLTVGYFSKTQGVLPKQDTRRNDASPIVVQITSLTVKPAVSIKEIEVSAKSTSNIKYGLYCRVPGTVQVTVDCGNLVHYSNKFVIAQKGFVVPLPADYLNNQKYAVEFDSETGALKTISSN